MCHALAEARVGARVELARVDAGVGRRSADDCSGCRPASRLRSTSERSGQPRRSCAAMRCASQVLPEPDRPLISDQQRRPPRCARAPSPGTSSPASRAVRAPRACGAQRRHLRAHQRTVGLEVRQQREPRRSRRWSRARPAARHGAGRRARAPRRSIVRKARSLATSIQRSAGSNSSAVEGQQGALPAHDVAAVQVAMAFAHLSRPRGAARARRARRSNPVSTSWRSRAVAAAAAGSGIARASSSRLSSVMRCTASASPGTSAGSVRGAAACNPAIRMPNAPSSSAVTVAVRSSCVSSWAGSNCRMRNACSKGGALVSPTCGAAGVPAIGTTSTYSAGAERRLSRSSSAQKAARRPVVE